MKFDKGDKVTIYKIPLGVGRNIKYSDLEIGLCGIVQYAHTNCYGVKIDNCDIEIVNYSLYII